MRSLQPETYLKNVMSNLQVHIRIAHYGKCAANWGEVNDIPPEFDRFYYFKGGEGFLNIDGTAYTPHKDQVFLLPAGKPNAFGTISLDTYERYFVHFTAKIGETNLFQLLDVRPWIEAGPHTDLEREFAGLVEAYRSQAIGSSLRARASLLQIIAYFVEHAPIRRLNISDSSAMEKIHLIVQHMEHNLSRDITVDELAGLVHFHPNYFINYFKKMLGLSPIQYMNRTRVERAKQLLRASDMSIGEIAETIGFQPQQFTKVFKKSTGHTPSEFRKL